MEMEYTPPLTLKERLRKYLPWILGVVVGIPTIMLMIVIYNFEYETKQLIDYRPYLTTEVYDRNGDKIANLFSDQNRYYVTFDQIPPHLVEALLAIEDTQFFEHQGINPGAIFRAIVKDVSAGRLKEGASTITQQLVKNTLLTREKKLLRKFKEVLYAMRIEQQLSKEEILERYFNEIYLGHGFYGVKTAANGYFHKQLNQLTLKEMAMLVGLPKSPNFYAPTRNYELCLGRANRVISRMYDLGWIDRATYDQASQERPVVYDDTLTRNAGPYIVDEVMRQLRTQFPDIEGGGYKVYTTIDMRLQNSAYKALQSGRNEILKRAQESGDLDENLQQNLNGALVSVDPMSGEVLALVGGYDYSVSPFNRATQTRRQPGSAFKPFIYQVALDSGLSPESLLPDMARSYKYRDAKGEEKIWNPKNYHHDYKGMVTMRDALTNSRNLATVNMVSDFGFNRIFNGLQQFGFTPEMLPRNLSLALGTINLSPWELAHYFTMFSNKGTMVKPILITKVVTPKGEIIEFQTEKRQVDTPQQIYLMTSMLKDVVNKGTGMPARVYGMDIAGKTGTTNKNVDAWFIGYSPTVQTVVWFGNDNNTPMRYSETGGHACGSVFRYFYEDMMRIYPTTKRFFDIPPGVSLGGISVGDDNTTSDVNEENMGTSSENLPSTTDQSTAPKTTQKLLF